MSASRVSGLGWRGAWALAWRDLSGSFRGLRLLFICLFLGVGTLAAIGSLTSSITGELAARGQTLLGGDVEMSVAQREATAQEKSAFSAIGTMSETIRMRAMAQRIGPQTANTPSAVLSELKGVDNAYPLYGALTLANGRPAPRLGDGDVLIGQALVDRLGVTVGDGLRFGGATFRIVGVVGAEPDRVGEGFTLGPVALTSMGGIRSTGLLMPGSLFTSKYRLRLPATADAPAAVRALEQRYKDAGWEVKGRDRASPSADRFFDRMGQFLSLIGLTALVIAGIGVSNGVGSYLTAKRNSIATLKILGASSADILRIYLCQVGGVALAAIAAGLCVGALLPPALVAVLGDVLPVRPGLSLQILPLSIAALYGALIALIFTLPPLARARTQPAAALFREAIERRWSFGAMDWRSIGAVTLAALAVIALAMGTSDEPLFSAIILASVAGVLLLLLGIGWGVRWLAQRLPRPRRPLLRLAVTNLYRPGAQTPALVIALGLALTLFVTLAGIQTSLNAEIARTVPARAPDAFILDIPSADVGAFTTLARQTAPGAEVKLVPALRGTIIAYGATRVADLAELPDGAWFLRGERGVTYAETLPEGSELVAGQWWAADYAGPPLVSLDAEAAAVMGVGVGDRLTISVLGREIETRIASLRKVNWETMGFNYILVFSPHTLRAAPHTFAATISMDDADQGPLSRALLSAFPSISIIAVGEVLGQVTALLGQMSSAILSAASITILAGIAVLVGAIAASRQSRSYDSVIMKTLGATRRQILAAQMIEYALLAGVLAAVALALGGFAAWTVIVLVFKFHWLPNWGVMAATLIGGAIITLGIGLGGSLPLMNVRPASALRQL